MAFALFLLYDNGIHLSKAAPSSLEEIQLKIMMRYHPTPVRMAKMSNTGKNILVRMRRKGNFLTLLVGMQAGAAALENSMEVPQKIKTRATP